MQNITIIKNFAQQISGLVDFHPMFILFASVIIAWIIKFLFEKILKGAFHKTKTEIDGKMISALKKPIFWSVFIFGSYLFINQYDIAENLYRIVSDILKTFILLVWLKASLNLSALLIIEFGNRENKDGKVADIVPFLKSFSKILLYVVALTVLFNIWGIDIAPILASAGFAGIAVAFAAKDTVSNLFGGVSVFFDKSYTMGDYVIIDDKYRGEVIKIGIRSTKIRTRDDVLITVPNSVMVTNAVINQTGLDGKLRVRVPLGLADGTNLSKAEKVIVSILESHREVLKVPAPRVRYRKFGDSTIDLEALFVISDPANRGRITHEVIKKLDRGLRKEGIEMPPPQMEVSLDQSGVKPA